MVIEVQLLGKLREICAFGSTGVVSVDIPDGYTVKELMEELELDSRAVLDSKVNGSMSSIQKKLKDGDTVVLYPSNNLANS